MSRHWKLDCVREHSSPEHATPANIPTAQVETQLKTGPNETSGQAEKGPSPKPNGFQANLPGRHASGSPHTFAMDTDPQPMASADAQPPSMEPSWDMVALGLEEPLPTLEVQTELWVTDL